MPETAATIYDRWRAFAGEYIKHFNGQRAVEECGCYKARGDSARARATQLLSNEKVQVVIREAITARNARTHVDQDRVILELARVAFAEGRSIGDWNDDGLHLTPSGELSHDDAAAVSEVIVEIEEFETESGIRRKVKRRFKVHDKIAALDKLARHVGLYAADNKLNINFDEQIKESRSRISEVLTQTGERLSHVNTNGHRDP